MGSFLPTSCTRARAASDERQRFYNGIFHGLFHRDGRDRFLDHFEHDLHLVRSDGQAAPGRAHLAPEVDSDTEARVRIEPQRVFGSGHITLLEARFVNPPENPHHCPPGMALVIFQRAYRLHLHLSPRPPRIGDD